MDSIWLFSKVQSYGTTFQITLGSKVSKPQFVNEHSVHVLAVFVYLYYLFYLIHIFPNIIILIYRFIYFLIRFLI